MKRGLKAGFAWGMMLLGGVAPASEADVTWETFDCPPMYISDGQMAGQGFNDRQLRTLIQHLPAMTHRIADMTIARAWYGVEHQDAACILGVRRTPEREKIALFSRPLSIARGSRLVLPTDRVAEAASLLGSDGAVDLDRLAARGDLRGGYIGRRDYGEGISRLIQDSARLVPLEAVPNERQLFRLLEARRIDFFFSYPSEIEYYRGGESHNLSMLPVHDDQGAVENYVACSSTPAGRRIIDQINQLLADPEIYGELQAPRENWTRSASLR